MKFFKYFLVVFFITLIFAIYFLNSKISAQEIDAIEVCSIQSCNVRNFVGFVKSQLYSNLSFQSEGEIVFFPYSKGDYVKKGQIIARLDGVLYKIKKREEQARLNEAVIQYEKSKNYYKRMDILHKQGAISDNDWEEAFYQLRTNDEQIKIQKEKINYLNKEINYNMIVAPYSGYIADKFSQVGAYAKIGEPVLSIMTSDKTRIEFMVGDDVINDLFCEKEVVVNKDSNKYKGKIKHISKNSFNSGGYLIKVDLDELILDFIEGMNVDVQISFSNILTPQIPLSAIFEDDNKKFVYKIISFGGDIAKIEKQNITTGQIYADKIEVLSGLKPGEFIACGNIGNIDLNKKVKIRYEK